MRNKPEVVIFFGGEKGNHDLSAETGHWMCQYIPRDKYRVKPVRITTDGKWQVPLGYLPQHGSVSQMIDRLYQAVPALSPAEGLTRLLDKPVKALMSVLRGKGGDDGGTQQLGALLNVPVIGSPAEACQTTSNKHSAALRLDSIVNTPFNLDYNSSWSTQEIIEDLRNNTLPPLFVKSATAEGSGGVIKADSLTDIPAAINRAKMMGDVLVQEHVPGKEITITLIEAKPNQVTALPSTTIIPNHASFYDHLAKRMPGRVHLHNHKEQGDNVIEEAEDIAREVWEELNLSDYASFDFIVNNDGVTLLEVNTVPVLSSATPLRGQLETAGLHPGLLLDTLLKKNLAA